MTAGRATVVAVAVLTVGVTGTAGGTPDDASFHPERTVAGMGSPTPTRSAGTPNNSTGATPGPNDAATGSNDTATTPGGATTTPGDVVTPGSVAPDAAIQLGSIPIRSLSTAAVAGRTGSGVVVVDERGRVLLRAFVRLTCTTLAVDAAPPDRRYGLRLVYVDVDTGSRRVLYAAPLNGTVTDPFGRTPLVLVRVELRFLGRIVLTRTIPEQCPGPDERGSTASAVAG